MNRLISDSGKYTSRELKNIIDSLDVNYFSIPQILKDLIVFEWDLK